jgi:hypothetical protein
MELPALLRSLRHRNYRLFLTGQLISLTGTWMDTVVRTRVVSSWRSKWNRHRRCSGAASS